jgi:hypothetical protein
MHTNSDRLQIVAVSSGYRSLPANHTIRWSAMYEVA